MADYADVSQAVIDREAGCGITSVLAALPQGESALYCEECGEEIPDARRQAMPGVATCIHCASELEGTRR